MQTPEQAVARWKPRIDWPESDTATLIADAREHVREHQASVAFERDIPDDLVRRGSPCPRKAVINFVREEYSSYQRRIEDKSKPIRDLMREHINAIIGKHYASIACTCTKCPS